MANTKGFTMMELLVTVLLIGILAAMAMPQYVKVVEKQKGTEAVNILAVIGKSQERYFAVNEKYTSDFADLDSDLVDFNTKAAAKGSSYNTKYFVFLLDGTDDTVSKVKATRRGNESYILERNYTTGEVCCRNDNTADGDICDVLDLPNDTCSGEETPSEPPTPTCTGTQPAASQSCASGCGTQTRSVTCNNGTWTTGSWTGTCTAPTQTLPTSQTCGTNGTQTRTCSASCSGGACGAWSTCVTTTCTGTQPAATQACASGCGTQTRSVTCNNGTWATGSWTGTCTAPTQTQPTSQSCGNGGTQTRTCTADCSGGACGAWSACTGQTCDAGTKPAESQACGNCGTQTRTVSCDTATGNWTMGNWGTCTGGGTCAPGATQSCGTGGIQICNSACSWDSCECNPATRPAGRQDCNDCGIQTATSITCNNGKWNVTWSACTGYYVMEIRCCDGYNHTVNCKAGGSWNYMYSCGYANDPENPGCKDSFVKTDPHPLD